MLRNSLKKISGPATTRTRKSVKKHRVYRAYVVAYAKPPANIPGIEGKSGMDEFNALGGYQNYSKALCGLQKKYGDVVKVDIPMGLPAVYVFHPDDIQSVFKMEGKYPYGVAQVFGQASDGLEQSLGLNPSIIAMSGNQWKEHRSLVQKDITPPPVAQSYLPLINVGSKHLVDNFAKLQGFNETYAIISLELFHQLAFGSSIGVAEANFENSEWHQFIKNGIEGFRTAIQLVQGKNDEKANIAVKYKQLAKLTGDMSIKASKRAINDPNLAKLPVKPYIQRLFERGEEGQKEIEGGTMRVLIHAALDTTANSLAYLLVHLAEFPHTQEKLFNEIYSTCKGNPLQEENLKNIPYLRACVKENFRVIFGTGNSRVLDQEITIRDYKIPPNTLIDVFTVPYCRSEEVYPNPKEFNPDRWLTPAAHPLHNHPYMILPFGVGARMCIGARIAETEIFSFIAMLLQKYQLKVLNGPFTLMSGSFPQPYPKPIFELIPRKL